MEKAFNFHTKAVNSTKILLVSWFASREKECRERKCDQ
jgi:hypothetical protein